MSQCAADLLPALVRLPDERARLRAHRRPARGDGPAPRRRRPTTPACSSTTPAPSGRRPTPAWPGIWAPPRRLKREDPSRLVVVAGCLAQSRREEFFADFPFVDVLVGPQSLHELPALLERAAGRRASRWGPSRRAPPAGAPICPGRGVTGPSAWVQIVAGCSNFCSYCIVPYVRGPEASRPAADILAEVRAAGGRRRARGHLPGPERQRLRQGARVRGQRDLRRSAGAAVRRAGASSAIRFMTSHPKDVSDALIDVMAAPQPGVRAPAPAGAVGQRPRSWRPCAAATTARSYLDLVGRLARRPCRAWL